MRKGVIAGMSLLFGAVSGTVAGMILGGGAEEKTKKIGKFKGYYNLLNQWLINKNEGKDIASYFDYNGYKKIAIYGMGELGNRLFEELKNSKIEIKYAIDKNMDGIYTDMEVFGLKDNLEEVDVVVVTAIFAFDEIKEELSKKLSNPIISLEEVVYEV